MKRLSFVCALALVVALLAPAAFAEAPRFDARRSVQVPVARLLPTYLAQSDGPITMADNGHGMRLAVWAYQSGLEVDIALSRRVGNTWSAVQLFGEGNGLVDYAPDIAFLPDGRPVVAWTQRDLLTGGTDVVFSLLTASGWTEPERINPEGTNASSPHLVPSEARLSVVFADASGQLTVRAFSTGDEASDGDTSGQSGSNGPDPMPNIRVPPETDPNQFPLPRETIPQH